MVWINSSATDLGFISIAQLKLRRMSTVWLTQRLNTATCSSITDTATADADDDASAHPHPPRLARDVHCMQHRTYMW